MPNCRHWQKKQKSIPNCRVYVKKTEEHNQLQGLLQEEKKKNISNLLLPPKNEERQAQWKVGKEKRTYQFTGSERKQRQGGCTVKLCGKRKQT